jgi:hypothetical protein
VGLRLAGAQGLQAPTRACCSRARSPTTRCSRSSRS